MGKLLAMGAKKLVLGVGGIVVALVWMSVTGGSDGVYEELDRVPEVAFGGGAGTLSIEVEVSQEAQLKTSFSQWDEETEDETAVYASETVFPGTFVRSVDVAPDTYVYFEVGVPEATVGATLAWTVYLDGEEIWRESERLEEALEDGYAFFVQLEADSIEQLRSWGE